MSHDTGLSHGGRPTRGKKRKGAGEYAAENSQNFVSRSIMWNGQPVQVLVCRICGISVGARSDRIKEHLCSKRHKKYEAMRLSEVQNGAGQQDFNQSEHTFEPPIIKYSSICKILEGNKSRAEEKQQRIPKGGNTVKMPTPPPPPLILKEHLMSSLSPPQQQQPQQNIHPVSPPQINDPVHGTGVGESNVHGRNGSLTERGRSAVSSSSSSRGRRFCTTPASSSIQPSSLSANETPSLLLRWKGFDSNIVSMFSKYRDQKLFIDATLVCENKTILCHQLVLACASEYFENMFKSEVFNSHPIIALNGIRFREAEALVGFMYSGEVDVKQENVQSLLRTAALLQIKGLHSPSNETRMSSDDDTEQNTRASIVSSGSGQDSGVGVMEEDDNGVNAAVETPTITIKNSYSCRRQLKLSPKLLGATSAKESAGSGRAVSGTGTNLFRGNATPPLNLPTLWLPSLDTGIIQNGNGYDPASKTRRNETMMRSKNLPSLANQSTPNLNSRMDFFDSRKSSL